MTKIVAYCALLYGSDYLAWSIRSLIDYVDELHIGYDQFGHGSHGSYTDVVCPDTRNDLYTIAMNAAGSKLFWHDDGPFAFEGQQRDRIYQYAPDADLIITLDYDEIWQPGLPELAIKTALESDTRSWRIPFRHYWRSFHRCVLHDPAYPVRIINTRAREGENTLDAHGLAINHCGYAIKPEICRYKWQIHGHKGQLRTDVNWFQDVFMANRQYDTHPVGSQYWNPEPVNPFEYMPEWMKDHPYFNMAVIE